MLVTSSAIQRVELRQSLIQRRLLGKMLVTSSSWEEELNKSLVWRNVLRVLPEEVELKEAAWREIVITSSTSNRWSSRTAWRSRRMLFSRLLRWRSFKRVPRELVFSRCMWRVGKQFRPTLDCRWMFTSASFRGHLWDKLERISRRMWWMFCIAYWDITTVGVKFTKTGTDPKHIVRKLICFYFYLLFCLRQICLNKHISICFCLVLGNLG